MLLRVAFLLPALALLAGTSLAGTCGLATSAEYGDIITDGPGDYLNNANCQWDVDVSAATEAVNATGILYLVDLNNVEGGYDFLSYQTEEGDSYIIPPDEEGLALCSPGLTGSVTFTSDGSVTYSGFSVEVSVYFNESECNTNGEPGTGTDYYGGGGGASIGSIIRLVGGLTGVSAFVCTVFYFGTRQQPCLGAGPLSGDGDYDFDDEVTPDPGAVGWNIDAAANGQEITFTPVAPPQEKV